MVNQNQYKTWGLCWRRNQEKLTDLQINRQILVVVIYEGLYFDLAQGQMNGAPNETDTCSIS